ncbi:MAG: cadmium-translocating P-type ATPase, partial [Clostridia bacterium]|nr:cadmium-translocating P-type ATPase [Clostridia bacterium]
MSRKQKKNLWRILAAGILMLAATLVPAEVYPQIFGVNLLRFAVFLVPYFIVGWDVLYTALRNLLGGRLLDEKFLMAIATVGAFALGEYVEGTAVMLLYQVGELFQSIAVGRSRKNIASLMDIRPDTATVLRDGEALTVSPDEVAVGECLRVLPGEKIPLDGVVTDGESQVNTAALTGESLPQDVKVGDRVVSGSVNMSGVLTVRVESLYAESTVAKILDLVENAAERKARVESFITRFAHWYTPVVVGVALLLAVLPPIIDGNWGEWVGRALIFLVVSCPCALVISVPLSFFGGIGGASRRGILIKGAEYLETLARVHTVVFDKTGTLTCGSFRVTALYPQADITADDLLALAAAAESRSTHPIAQSVLAAVMTPPKEPDAVTELAGRGVMATVEGETVLVGNAKLMEEYHITYTPCTAVGTVLYVAAAGEFRGALLLSDEAKPGAKEAVASLKKHGVKQTVMLTGD